MKLKNHVGVNIQQWKTEMETTAESGTVAGIMPSDYFWIPEIKQQTMTIVFNEKFTTTTNIIIFVSYQNGMAQVFQVWDEAPPSSEITAPQKNTNPNNGFHLWI